MYKDMLYHPSRDQSTNVSFDIEPCPKYDTPTDILLCCTHSESEREHSEDLRMLEEMRKKPLKFRKFEDFMGDF